MTKIIELTQGQVALVSDHRFEELNQYKWHAWWSEQTQSYYARRNVKLPDGSVRVIGMHRQIMGDPTGKIVDHINHDTLNNTDENLRAVTRAESMWNTRAHRDGRLGMKNITTFPNGRYGVQIMAKGERHQRSFRDLAEAIAYRDCMRDKLHGRFSYAGDRL
jgi:hypothetical protein